MAPTPANLTRAARILADVRQAVRSGTFDYAAWFPDAKNAPRDLAPVTFDDYATRFLKSLGEKASSTREDYERAINSRWLPAFRGRLIKDIRYSDIVDALDTFGVSGKTRNNLLIPLRGVFKFAKKDRVIKESPADEIENSKVQSRPPDPLELHEVETVLADLAAHEDPQTVNYFTAAIFAGFRPSEQIALTWADLDKASRTVRVDKARVRAIDKGSTKTHVSRDVELTDRAFAAFQAQRAFTELANGAIFHNPDTGKPWNDVQIQMRRWTASLRRCGLRHRETYQTRHTFATLALMAGANPMWVARQLGHANMGMLLKVYGKWIDAADKGRERAKLDAGFRTNVTKNVTKNGAES